MFGGGKDKNRYEVNIKAERPAKVISLKEAKRRRNRRPEGFLGSVGTLDLKTPWVMRLLAVVFILILSMLIL